MTIDRVLVLCSGEEVGRVLGALGRPLDEAARQNIVGRHAGKGGRVDWSQAGFLKEIAQVAVTEVSGVEEFVLSSAFSTFDQVKAVVCKSFGDL